MKKKKLKAVHISKLDTKTKQQIRVWRNQPFVREMMYTQHEITEEEHKRYLDKIENDDKKGIYVFYLDDEPFEVFQYEINKNNYVESGLYLIKEEYQGLGYGVIGSYVIGQIVFDVLKVNKSYGENISCNTRADRMNSFGGKLEGTLRKHKLVDGKYYDVNCYGLLADEWPLIKVKLEKLVLKFIEKDVAIVK